MLLPYFPLHTVLFPHLPLPLQIFEERYRAMTRDLLSPRNAYQGRFVVSMITDGVEVGGDARTRRVGTVCEIRSAEQLADGRYILLAVGVARAVLGAIDHDGPYARVQVEPLDELDGSGAEGLLPDAQAALDAYLATVKQFVAAAASHASDSREVTSVADSLEEVLKPIRLPDDPLAASYAIGGVLQIELTRKQHLLELPDAATRLRAEIDLLRRESSLLADGAMPPVSTADLTFNPN
jgi:Lon protease-like protein